MPERSSSNGSHHRRLERAENPEQAARNLEAHLGGLKLTVFGGQRGIARPILEGGLVLTPSEAAKAPSSEERKERFAR